MSAASASDDPFLPLPAIEQYLDEVSRGLGEPGALTDAVRYALLSGGKRLRPLLAWHSCVAAGGRGEESLAAGAAVEMVHAFSLVHDDLPAIDNDDLRRGRPTLHRHAGEAMAILAGDALLAGAFEMASRACGGGGGDSCRLALVRELSNATIAMIRGQVWDTLGGLDEGLAPEESLRAVHRNKTGALLRASVRMGALSAARAVGGEPSVLAALTACADAMGLMFQIVDDLLDVEQTTAHLGKRTGKDVDAGKLTYPGVLGVEASRAEVGRLRDAAITAVRPLGEAARSLVALAEYMATRTK